MRKLTKCLALVLVGAMVLSGCGKKDKDKVICGGQFDAVKKGETVAEIVIKDYGSINVKFFPDKAPKAVENFITHAKDGYYDGLTFHRIMDGFMIQGGGFDENMEQKRAEPIVGEFAANGVENKLSHTRGAISMARNGFNMDSASSQFFIVHQDSTFLDGNYACFGYVTEGIEVVDRVCEASQPIDDNGTILPEDQPVIAYIRIVE